MDDARKGSVISVHSTRSARSARSTTASSDKNEKLLDLLRDALKLAFRKYLKISFRSYYLLSSSTDKAGGDLKSKTWPWNRLTAAMALCMIVCKIWPYNVYTPAETKDASKGLAVLSPTSQQVLYEAVTLANSSDIAPFFTQVDSRTWKMCKSFVLIDLKKNITNYVYRLREQL